MIENNRFDSHLWCTRRYTCFTQSGRLVRAVVLYALLRVFHSLRGLKVNGFPNEEFFRPGESATTAPGDRLIRSGRFSSFHAQVAQLVDDALASGEPVNMRRLQEILQQRFREWQDSRVFPSPKAQAATIEDWVESFGSSLNPYAPVFAYHEVLNRVEGIQTAATQQRRESSDEAQQCEDTIRRMLPVAVQRFENRVRALTGGSVERPHKRLCMDRIGTLAGLLTFVLVFVFLSQTALAAFTWAVAAVVATVIYLKVTTIMKARRHAHAPSESTRRAIAQAAQAIFSPVRNELISYFSATEKAHLHALEAQVASDVLMELRQSSLAGKIQSLAISLDRLVQTLEEWKTLPDGPFYEPDPGCVELWGCDLAKDLYSQQVSSDVERAFAERVLQAFAKVTGARLGEVLADCDDIEAVKEALMTIASNEIGAFTLSGTLQVIARKPNGDQLLAQQLETLADVARSAVHLQRGIRVDETLSPELLLVGLPGGAEDPHVGLVKQVFPHASLFVSSVENGIEIIYDIRNLRNDQLLSYELSSEAYEAANPFERDLLWHFPPRDINRKIRCLPGSQENIAEQARMPNDQRSMEGRSYDTERDEVSQMS